MKSLLEIAKIVTKKRVNKIEIFDEQTLKRKKSKFNEFYEALQSGKFTTDQGAAAFLYDSTPTDDRYRQLKSRFRKRLLATLFFLDVNRPSASSYDKAYFTCNKDWTLVKILLANNAKETAVSLAKRILNLALNYKFADVVVNCARILRKYAAEVGDEKDFELYDQYGKQFQDVLSAEIRSEELLQRVSMHWAAPYTRVKSLEEHISTYCDALDSLAEMYDSSVLTYNRFLVWIYRYHMLRDFDKVVEFTDQVLHYMAEHPNYQQAEVLETVVIKRLSAYLHLLDFESARSFVERYGKRIGVGSDAWFEMMEYYFLISTHTDNINQALAIYQQAVGHKAFKKLDVKIKYVWQLFELYLHYAYYINHNEASKFLKSTKGTKFRLRKFLNEPVLFPLRHRIFAIHNIIFQVLFLIEKRKFDEATDRIDQLRSFANRLNGNDYFRVINFIRLLQQLPKSGFNVKKLTLSEKYYQRLLEHPFYYRGTPRELEIIPWEKMWNQIVARL